MLIYGLSAAVIPRKGSVDLVTTTLEGDSKSKVFNPLNRACWDIDMRDLQSAIKHLLTTVHEVAQLQKEQTEIPVVFGWIQGFDIKGLFKQIKEAFGLEANINDHQLLTTLIDEDRSRVYPREFVSPKQSKSHGKSYLEPLYQKYLQADQLAINLLSELIRARAEKLADYIIKELGYEKASQTRFVRVSGELSEILVNETLREKFIDQFKQCLGISHNIVLKTELDPSARYYSDVLKTYMLDLMG